MLNDSNCVKKNNNVGLLENVQPIIYNESVHVFSRSPPRAWWLSKPTEIMDTGQKPSTLWEYLNSIPALKYNVWFLKGNFCVFQQKHILINNRNIYLKFIFDVACKYWLSCCFILWMADSVCLATLTVCSEITVSNSNTGEQICRTDSKAGVQI